jgi:hypothetical protein
MQEIVEIADETESSLEDPFIETTWYLLKKGIPVSMEKPEDGSDSEPKDKKLRDALVGILKADTEADKPKAIATVRAFQELLLLQADVLHHSEKEGWDEATLEVATKELEASPEYEAQTEVFHTVFYSWLKIYFPDKHYPSPKIKHEGALTATDFSIHTSQEMDIRRRAQCDGKTFNGWLMNDQAGAIVYEYKGAPHRVSLALSEDERAAGMAVNYLEKLIRSQDADAVLATEYILRVLAPPPHLPARYAGGWIDFDDVIKKIGWNPQTAKARREMHAQIWSFIKFGERAHIIGKRTGAKYQDGDGNEIDTTIHGAAWRVMKTETPDQPTLYAALETPVRAEIVVSKELTALLTSRYTAQYLMGGEILGAIPGGKPSGAWARVLGVALMSFWRRKPREHTAGTLKPTRRELLDHYAAKVAPYEEVLESGKPGRVIDYWCGAMQILADEGFIERSGEAAISAKTMRDALPRQNWQDAWLDEAVNIAPSAAMRAQIEERIKALPAPKPRDLKKKPRSQKRPKS